MMSVAEHYYVNFRYQIPGSGVGEATLWAVVCADCASDAKTPTKFPAIEGLINARIIRMEHPDYKFTPETWQ